MAFRSSFHTVRTHCPSCSLNCGFELEVNGQGELLGRRRWRGAPLTRGEVCPIGAEAWRRVDQPDRLTKPLIRRDGHLEVADWAEALDCAADGLVEIGHRHGSDANAVLGDGSLTNEKAYLLAKFGRLALRTRHVDRIDRDGLAEARRAYRSAFGGDRPMVSFEEIARADVIVLIGRDPTVTLPVVLPAALAKARRRGAEIIAIGATATSAATSASASASPESARGSGALELVPRAGSRGTLFVGLLAQAERNRRIDWSFNATRTDGIEGALGPARAWTPRGLADATGIDAARLEEAAATITGGGRVLYLLGPDPADPLTYDEATAVCNLALACGHAGRPGSGVALLDAERNGQGVGFWGLGHDELPGGRSIDDPFDRAVVSRRWGFDGGQIPPSGLASDGIGRLIEQGRIRGLLSIGVEPPAEIDHAVVIDSFPTEQTLERAAVVLPGTVLGEEEGTVTTVEGRTVRCDQAVPPVPRYSDIDVIRNLARRLGVRHQFDFVAGREVWEEMRRVSIGGSADHFGITWDRARDGVFAPCADETDPGRARPYLDRFGHEDGRARLRAVAFEAPPTTDPSVSGPSVSGRSVSGRSVSGRSVSAPGPAQRPGELLGPLDQVVPGHPFGEVVAGLL